MEMYTVYRVIHILGVALVTMAFGGILVHVMNGGTKQTNAFRKGAIISHGVGLLLILVAGFGMLARLGIHSFPMWVILKLVIWLALGGLVAVAYRKPQIAKTLWFVVPALVFLAALIGISKFA